MPKHSEDAARSEHPCQRCGSDEWTYVDYGGCSECRPHEERDSEDAMSTDGEGMPTEREWLEGTSEDAIRSDETREAFFGLHGYITHRDGCKCATEAHCASDCTCGMYAAMTRLQAALRG